MLYMPEARLALEPPVLEIIGGPDYFVDGRITRFHGEIVTSIFYVERSCVGETVNHEVFRVHYARTAWLVSLNRTLAALRGEAMH